MKTKLNVFVEPRLLFVIAIVFLAGLQPAIYAQPIGSTTFGQDASAARVGHLLEVSGYNFKQSPKSDKVWVVDFKGKSLASFKVVLATQDDLLVTFVTVTEKKRLPTSSEFLAKLLKFNHSLDRVKIGIDDDGDLFVRTDVTIRVLDNQEFKLNIEQVAAAADEVYNGIKPYLSSPTLPAS
jgi:hypothetical protein